MSDLKVKVKNGAFEPASQPGSPGQTVKFKNERGGPVTVSFNSPGFFSKNNLDIQAGQEKSVQILATANGQGNFSAPQAGPEQDPLQGDIVINPSK